MGRVLKYDKDLYLDNGIYGSNGNGDFIDDDIACYKESLVKCRKIHTCAFCQKEIKVNDYALNETGFVDGKSISCYTCIDCIEEWLEESGQVDDEYE